MGAGKAERVASIDDLAPWPAAELVSAVRAAEGAVLDFGCGRGDFVLRCRAEGIEAYGIEPNPDYLTASADLAARLGCGDALRGSLDDFDEGQFAIVVSNQVLEHVADIERAAHGIARVTSDGGTGYHVFPARWRPVEPHLGMPLVHWLPPRPRRHAIRWWAAAGVHPGWEDGSPQRLWRYSVDKTHYRSVAAMTRAFAGAGLTPCTAPPGPAGWVRTRFRSVHLLTVKRRPAA